MAMRSVLVLGVGVSALLAGVPAVPSAAAAPVTSAPTGSRACPPSARAVGYSDALDKYVRDGVELGGLSSLAYDRRAHAWVSAVDNNKTDPARLWFFRDLAHPTVTRAPLVLRQPDGTPYNGTTADNEGLAVLPDGDYVVSSETEPSIRIYGRDGVQKASLPVPARFAVAPRGEATGNATLEGLTLSPSGRELVASMEGALSGDVDGTDTTAHRLLVYTRARHGWVLRKQIGYRTEPGNRIPEVAAIDDNRLLVEEAAFSTSTGNSVQLYDVDGLDRTRDVSGVADLGTAPARDIVRKTLVADLVKCPTLGAPAKETQTNPLLDNYEGMAVTARHRRHGVETVGVSLISDDNFSATQTTRVLNLSVTLPRTRRH